MRSFTAKKSAVRPALRRFKVFLLLIIYLLCMSLTWTNLPRPKAELLAAELTWTEAEKLESLEPKLADLRLASPLIGIYYQAYGGELQAIYTRRAEELYPPASLTKLMTIFVADQIISEEGIDLGTVYEIRAEDYAGLYENNIAACGFLAGDQLTVMDLLCGTLIASGADAVNALIAALGYSQEDFIARMNQAARELALDLHFSDAVGLYSEQQLVTAEGIAKLLVKILERPLLAQIMHYKRYRFPQLENFPEGREIEHSMNFYAEQLGLNTKLIQGGKTGWISQSGYNLASFQELAEGRVLIVTMGAAGVGEHVLDHLDILTTIQELIVLPSADLVNLAALRAQIDNLRYAVAEPSEEEPSAEPEASALSSENGSGIEDSSPEEESSSAESSKVDESLETSAEDSSESSLEESSAEPEIKRLEFNEPESRLKLPYFFFGLIGLISIVLLLFILEFISLIKRK
ncbi:MAG: serine hydrolase [Eubacteriales bacterium]|nr:serine hydrolase [Eubacteriales bacterium]